MTQATHPDFKSSVDEKLQDLADERDNVMKHVVKVGDALEAASEHFDTLYREDNNEAWLQMRRAVVITQHDFAIQRHRLEMDFSEREAPLRKQQRKELYGIDE